jgi:hypothetical protein
MEFIAYHLNIVVNHLKQRERSSISVGMTDAGNWNVADSDIEIAALVVVKWLLENNYNYLGQVNIIKDHPNYTLYLH